MEVERQRVSHGLRHIGGGTPFLQQNLQRQPRFGGGGLHQLHAALLPACTLQRGQQRPDDSLTEADFRSCGPAQMISVVLMHPKSERRSSLICRRAKRRIDLNLIQPFQGVINQPIFQEIATVDQRLQCQCLQSTDTEGRWTDRSL